MSVDPITNLSFQHGTNPVRDIISWLAYSGSGDYVSARAYFNGTWHDVVDASGNTSVQVALREMYISQLDGVNIDDPSMDGIFVTYQVRAQDLNTLEYSDWSTPYIRSLRCMPSVTLTPSVTNIQTHNDITCSTDAEDNPIGVTMTPSLTTVIDWKINGTVTVTMTPSLLYNIAVSTDFWYGMGDDDGHVYCYSPIYLSDDGDTIVSSWETIETDLGVPDTFKSVYHASLKYVDKSANLPISVDISNDGGATWTGAFKTVGTGNGKTKSKDFWFVESGEFFKFRVQTSSTDKDFQIIGLDVDFIPCGEAVEIS